MWMEVQVYAALVIGVTAVGGHVCVADWGRSSGTPGPSIQLKVWRGQVAGPPVE